MSTEREFGNEHYHFQVMAANSCMNLTVCPDTPLAFGGRRPACDPRFARVAPGHPAGYACVRQPSQVRLQQRERRVLLRSRVTLLAIVVMSTTALVSPEADTTETELLQRINEANAMIDQAAIEDDHETVASFYSDDVVVLPNHEPMIVGREAFIENEKAAREAGIKVVAIASTITQVFSSGDLIHEIGEYEVTLQVPGPPYPITDTGKYLVIWETQSDGSLKIKLEMWNNDAMPEY
ncbi:MAG: DUF4440 domain-containing protein [Candidatus Latescibacteria bacterium]|nr:DUF4440 domain-containing protein [Candidatus Latescibacterota bacterium]